MKEHHRSKVWKYSFPMLSVGLTITLLQNPGLGVELIDIPFHYPEPHWEEPFYHDYLGLMRDKTVPVATGTSTVLTFHENNSDS